MGMDEIRATPFSAGLRRLRAEALQDEYDALSRQLRRRGIDIAAIERKVAAFSVALPSWGAGRGGTRFAKFPFAGAPTDIHEKLEDCAALIREFLARRLR